MVVLKDQEELVGREELEDPQVVMVLMVEILEILEATVQMDNQDLMVSLVFMR